MAGIARGLLLCAARNRPQQADDDDEPVLVLNFGRGVAGVARGLLLGAARNPPVLLLYAGGGMAGVARAMFLGAAELFRRLSAFFRRFRAAPAAADAGSWMDGLLRLFFAAAPAVHPRGGDGAALDLPATRNAPLTSDIERSFAVDDGARRTFSPLTGGRVEDDAAPLTSDESAEAPPASNEPIGARVSFLPKKPKKSPVSDDDEIGARVSFLPKKPKKPPVSDDDEEIIDYMERDQQLHIDFWAEMPEVENRSKVLCLVCYLYCARKLFELPRDFTLIRCHLKSAHKGAKALKCQSKGCFVVASNKRDRGLHHMCCHRH